MEKTEIPKGGAHVEPGEHLSASTLLTGESFWDEATFREELERFYFRSWLNVGRSDQIPNPGDFFVWANLDDRASELPEEMGEFFSRFRRFEFENLGLGARKTYEVEANWKILGENYSECYHCAPIHPDLNRITHYTSGAYTAYLTREPRARNFNGGFMEFSKDYTSMVWSGYTKRPPLKGMTEEDRRRVDYYFVFPHMFFSLHPDYLMVHR